MQKLCDKLVEAEKERVEKERAQRIACEERNEELEKQLREIKYSSTSTEEDSDTHRLEKRKLEREIKRQADAIADLESQNERLQSRIERRERRTKE